MIGKDYAIQQCKQLIKHWNKIGGSLTKCAQQIEKFVTCYAAIVQIDAEGKEQVSTTTVHIDQWRLLGQSCHSACKKIYVQLQNDTVWLHNHFYLSSMIDASPSANRGFKFCGKFVPQSHEAIVPMGLACVMHNVRLIWHLLSFFYGLHTGTKCNQKIWLEYLWLCNHEITFCQWVIATLEKNIQIFQQPQTQEKKEEKEEKKEKEKAKARKRKRKSKSKR